MTQQPSGWYSDPIEPDKYRYWSGAQWTDQVSSEGKTSTDTNILEMSIATTPPAPGTEVSNSTQPPVAPTIQVTQKSGSAFGSIIGVALVVVVIIALILVLVNQSSDGSSTPVTETPATTVAP